MSHVLSGRTNIGNLEGNNGPCLQQPLSALVGRRGAAGCQEVFDSRPQWDGGMEGWRDGGMEMGWDGTEFVCTAHHRTLVSPVLYRPGLSSFMQRCNGIGKEGGLRLSADDLGADTGAAAVARSRPSRSRSGTPAIPPCSLSSDVNTVKAILRDLFFRPSSTSLSPVFVCCLATGCVGCGSCWTSRQYRR